jgi:hypothetical protein
MAGVECWIEVMRPNFNLTEATKKRPPVLADGLVLSQRTDLIGSLRAATAQQTEQTEAAEQGCRRLGDDLMN